MLADALGEVVGHGLHVQVGDEKDVALVAAELGQELGLAHAAPAIEDQKRGLRPRPEAIQQLQLSLAAHKRLSHLYYTLSL